MPPVTADAPVIVVGAGPVGLAMVALLARLGVPSILLEGGARLADRAGSRAICIQRDVLQILERVGCGHAVTEAGIHVRAGRTYFGARELFRTEIAGDPGARFPAYVSYPQVALEALLLTRIERDPMVDLRWCHRVRTIEQDGARVRAIADTPGGSVVVEGSHLIGCDGARSLVRAALGVRFDGYQHPESFLIADVRGRLPYAANERHFFFSPPFNPGRQVLLFPQPGGVWRIDWQVPEHFADPAVERASGRLAARIAKIAGHEDCELVWLSAYRFQQRVAERLRVGRVFLAGDAAHLMAPFGARGMTSGLADAENLAWKLACTRSGHGGTALLDSYDVERRAAAQHNVATVEASLRFMAPPTRRARVVRDAILHASRFTASAQRRVDAGKLYEPFAYRAGAIVAQAGRASEAGGLAADARCELVTEDATRMVHLRELLGASLLALYLPPVTDAREEAARFAARAASLVASLPVDAYVAVERDAAPGAWTSPVRALRDRFGELFARHPERGTMLLLRPDGHVAARHRGGPTECADALGKLVPAVLNATG